ncbi:MAG: hypothetical protein AB7D57_13200 [Desulfovibrionaceae bacterium]
MPTPRPLLALTASALALAAVLLLLELGLRLLPVNEGLHTQPVDAAHPMLHFEPDRTLTWSRFPDFAMRNTVHVNNAGFVSDQDYDPADPRPLVAVVGDSYVEAAMVPWAETGHGRLARLLAPGTRVYAFGASGAPLSQYLACADWVRRTYAPARLVVVVVGNDFDESLFRPGAMPGFHYFREGPAGLELVRKDYAPSLWTRLARRSRLALYLAVNVQAGSALRGLLHGQDAGDPAAFVGQTAAAADAARLAASRRVVDAFLERLAQAAGLPPGDVLLVVDGMRPNLYDPAGLAKAKGSYFDEMRTYLMTRARTMGYRVADMQPVFRAHWLAHGQRFEFPRDGHWNALGHERFARAVLDSGLLTGLPGAPEGDAVPQDPVTR